MSQWFKGGFLHSGKGVKRGIIDMEKDGGKLVLLRATGEPVG
jgi:hypothetical protein